VARALGVVGEQKQYAVQRRLRLQILAHVIVSQPTADDEVIQAARVAEVAQTVIDQTTTSTTASDVDRMIGELAASMIVAEANNQEIRKLTNQLAKQPAVSNISRSPSPSSQRDQWPARRRVTFADDVPQRTYRQSSQSSRGRFINYQRQRGSSAGRLPTMLCGNCGGNHQFGRRYCRS